MTATVELMVYGAKSSKSRHDFPFKFTFALVYLIAIILYKIHHWTNTILLNHQLTQNL